MFTVATSFCDGTSITDIVDAPTLLVKICFSSRVMSKKCVEVDPVGSVPTIAWVFGSMIRIDAFVSAVTYSFPLGPSSGKCGRL